MTRFEFIALMLSPLAAPLKSLIPQKKPLVQSGVATRILNEPILDHAADSFAYTAKIFARAMQRKIDHDIVNVMSGLEEGGVLKIQHSYSAFEKPPIKAEVVVKGDLANKINVGDAIEIDGNDFIVDGITRSTCGADIHEPGIRSCMDDPYDS